MELLVLLCWLHREDKDEQSETERAPKHCSPAQRENLSKHNVKMQRDENQVRHDLLIWSVGLP